MRKLAALALLCILAIPTTAAAEPSTTRFRGSGFGVVGVLHHVDDAGVETTGYLFGVNVLSGALPDVPFDQAVVFAGERYYPDLGYSVPFLGAGEATYSSRGLNGADVVGMVEALPFYDGTNLPPDPLPPITIEVDLTFTGIGSTSATGGSFSSHAPGEVYVLVSAQRWRYADVTGSVTLDGSAATVDTAQVLAETSSEFNLVVLH